MILSPRHSGVLFGGVLVLSVIHGGLALDDIARCSLYREGVQIYPLRWRDI